MAIVTKNSTLDRDLDRPPTPLRIAFAISLFIIVVSSGVFALIFAETSVWKENLRLFQKGHENAIKELQHLKILNILDRLATGDGYRSKLRVRKELKELLAAIKAKDRSKVYNNIYFWLKSESLSSLLEEHRFPYILTLRHLEVIKEKELNIKRFRRQKEEGSTKLINTNSELLDEAGNWYFFLNLKHIGLEVEKLSFYQDGLLKNLPKVEGIRDNILTITDVGKVLSSFLSEKQMKRFDEAKLLQTLRTKRMTFHQILERKSKLNNTLKKAETVISEQQEKLQIAWNQVEADVHKLSLIIIAPPNL
jgi:hypothetical protein